MKSFVQYVIEEDNLTTIFYRLKEIPVGENNGTVIYGIKTAFLTAKFEWFNYFKIDTPSPIFVKKGQKFTIEVNNATLYNKPPTIELQEIIPLSPKVIEVSTYIGEDERFKNIDLQENDIPFSKNAGGSNLFVEAEQINQYLDPIDVRKEMEKNPGEETGILSTVF